jgi:hypothetical protein
MESTLDRDDTPTTVVAHVSTLNSLGRKDLEPLGYSYIAIPSDYPDVYLTDERPVCHFRTQHHALLAAGFRAYGMGDGEFFYSFGEEK